MKIFKFKTPISKPALVCAIALLTTSCHETACEKAFFGDFGFDDVAVTPPSNPQAYVDANNTIFSFNGPDSPGAAAATKFQITTDSMVFWEQSANPQVAAENITGTFSRLFFTIGGNLEWADTAGTSVYGTNFDPKISSVLAVDSVATSSADGGWLYASHPNDAAVSLFGGGSFTQKQLIRLPGRAPTKLAVAPSGSAFALSDTKLLSFDLTGETGNVSIPAGATGLDASDKYVVVANQGQSSVLIFDSRLNPIGQSVTVTGANRVAIVGDSAFVTGTIGSATTSAIQNTTQGLYTIVQDTTGQTTAPSVALPVTAKLADGWLGSIGGLPFPKGMTARWVGPSTDETNVTRNGCCAGSTDFYQTKFTVTDATKTGFIIDVAADEYVDVKLNGALVFTHTSTAMYGSTTRFVIKSVVGSNTLEFDVFNTGGGPTGLLVSVTPVLPGNVTQIDLTNQTITGTVAVGANPGDIRAASSGVLLVANTGDTTVSILNGLSVTKTVTVGTGPSVIAVKPGPGAAAN